MLSHSSLTVAQKDALAQQELAGCARPAPRMLSRMLSCMLSCSGVTKGGPSTQERHRCPASGESP